MTLFAPIDMGQRIGAENVPQTLWLPNRSGTERLVC